MFIKRVLQLFMELKLSVKIVMIGALLMMFMLIPIKVTGATEFCNSFHIMNDYYSSWQTSSHLEVNCLLCHLQPGFGGYIKGKINGLAQAVDYAVGRVGTKPNAVGVLTVWMQGDASPLQYVIQPDHIIALDDPPVRLTVLQYMPHYSVDKTTKEVVNLSEEPVNPAVEIRAEYDGKIAERWVWARFSDPPHQRIAFPVRVTFSNYRLGQAGGRYLIVACKHDSPRILFHRDHTPILESLQLDHR